MALGNSASVLFHIRADNSDAKRAFNETERDIKGLSGVMGAMGGPGAIAAAAVTAVATAAVAAVAGLVRLTIATSEFGSKLYDASIQTGLSARSISALKLAADTSGSSLEAVSGAVSKLNVLVGNAANGNVKAKQTLADYGITAKDTNTAFEQAISAIGAMTDQGQRATAMFALFKDRVGAMGPVIDAVGGDFKAFRLEAERLGLTLTEQDLRAADEFGDTLDILGKQAAAAGQQFALELMPNVTHAMQTISGEMANNQGVAREWGRGMGETIRGIELSIGNLRTFAASQFSGLALILGQDTESWADWSIKVLASMHPVLAAMMMLKQGGAANPIDKMVYEVGDEYSPAPNPMGARVPKLTDGATKGPKGKTPEQLEREEEARRRKAFQDAVDDLQRQFNFDQQLREQSLKDQELYLAQGKLSEEQYADEIIFIAKRTSEEKIKLLEAVLKAAQQYQQETEDIESRLSLARGDEGIRQIQDDIDAWKKYAETMKDLKKASEKFNETMRKIHEDERERNADNNRWLDELRKKREEEDAEAEQRRLKKYQDRIERTGPSRGGVGGGIAGSMGVDLVSIFDPANIGVIREAAEHIKAIYEDLRQTTGAAIGSMIQNLGQLAINWVLTGNFSAKAALQMAAGVLMGVGIQAAVKAWFEYAEAAAAAARYDFYSSAMHTAAAKMYLKTAIIAGGIGVGVGFASRALGGGGTSSSTGDGGLAGSGNSSSQQTNFGGRFNGFGSQIESLADTVSKATMVNAQLEETLHRFERKFMTATPGSVVIDGADAASREIHKSVIKEIGNGPGPTGDYMRGMGFAK